MLAFLSSSFYQSNFFSNFTSTKIFALQIFTLFFCLFFHELLSFCISNSGLINFVFWERSFCLFNLMGKSLLLSHLIFYLISTQWRFFSILLFYLSFYKYISSLFSIPSSLCQSSALTTHFISLHTHYLSLFS